jgi:vancomycin resistance protein YoaR
MPPHKKQKNLFIAFLISLIVISSVFLLIELINLGKIAYGLEIAGAKVGGAQIGQIENVLTEKFSQWENREVVFIYENKKFSAKPRELGITLDLRKTIDSAYNFGREKNIFLGIFHQTKLLLPFVNKNLSPVSSFNEGKFEQFTEEQFAGSENPAQNASLLYNFQSRDWETTPAKEGTIFDRQKIKNDLENRIAFLDLAPIELVLIDDFPEVLENETDSAKEKANVLLDNASYSLVFNSNSWEIDRETLLDWLKFIPVDENNNPPSPPPLSKGGISAEGGSASGGKGRLNKVLGAALNQEKIKNVLIEIAPSINQEPIDAELAMKDGKVVAFALSQEGIKLDIDKSAEKIEKEILEPSPSPFGTDNPPLPLSKGGISAEGGSASGGKGGSIELVVEKTSPRITNENIEKLGLTSLLGTGASNFAGSPKNRMHNIKVGTTKISGILLKPGEEFSFAERIGEIGAKQGYLPELVIKKNKTIPEYGGGICQVSTTIFRAAVNSGLKIIERHPHAFPVKYYNPQGFDATVYPPKPDLKFVNDTANNLLIQGKVEGTKLTFEFYGTPDSREIKIKGPFILESNPDGSMKTILYQQIWRDGQMEREDKFFSNYKSPDLYPVERNPLE